MTGFVGETIHLWGRKRIALHKTRAARAAARIGGYTFGFPRAGVGTPTRIFQVAM